MAVKLTKNEQKKQKDALKQFNRYLPTLQLKKQQLQLFIRQIEEQIRKYEAEQQKLIDSLDSWIAVFGENPLLGDKDILKLVQIDTIVKGKENVAGVEIPVFRDLTFRDVPYSLYDYPLWMDKFPQREPVRGRIIAVGRLAASKNYDGMIRAFAPVFKKHPYSRLYIYGAGDASDLEMLCKKLGISEGVCFVGMTKNVIEAYRCAEIFVMFSHGEGYPNALMEALAMGVPAISGDCPVGGPRDMIQDGTNGFLVPHEDESKLTDKMCILLEDHTIREMFSEAAISIRETNSFTFIYKKYMEYILNVR